MAFNRYRVTCLAALLVSVALVAGCGGKEERKANYLEKGKAYLAEGNYDKARIELKNVLQIDPKTAEAYQYLGEVEEAQQNWGKAFASYKKASELDPELIGSRIRLAKFYLAQYSALRAAKNESAAANVLGLAKEQTDEILKRAPDNPEGLTLQATLWVNAGEKERAIAQVEKVLSGSPGLASAAVLLAKLYDEGGRREDAEEVLKHAIPITDEPIQLRLRLSQLYLEHGQNDKAEEVLRRVVEEQPEKLAYRITLASFLVRTKQLDKAEQVLRDAIAADPDDIQRYRLLVDFLANQRSTEVAINELKRLIAAHPDLAELQFGLVGIYAREGKTDEAKGLLESIIAKNGVEPDGLKARIQLARIIASADPESPRVSKLIEEVLHENPRDNDALLIRGTLALGRKDYQGAINDFRSILRDQADSTKVLRLLAMAHQANGEHELARDTLARAIEIAPDDNELRISMAKLLLQGRDIDAALVQVDEVLKRDAKNRQALSMKYDLLARKGDMAGIEDVVKQLQVAAPDEEGGYIGEARLRIAQKDYDAALKLLDDVLQKNPDSVAALLAKSEALVGQRKYSEAVKVVEKLQKVRPDIMDGYFRKGRLLQQLGDDKGAIAQYEVALQKAPLNTRVLTDLVDLESQQEGGPGRAEKRLKDILAENPQHPAANGLLGMLYMNTKRFPEAEQAFLKQLDISPKDREFYPLLAQARIAQGDLDGAAAAFEQGLDRWPGNMPFMLGLAGVRERQKDYEAGISLYEKVLKKQPDNAIATNNLAALLADHRTDQASLDKAAELAGKLEKTSQPAFLDTAGWVHYRLGDYGKAIDILKRVVEKAPEVPVFRYHLGMAYFKKGDNDAARKHLNKAVTENAAYDGIEQARATLEDL